MKKKTLTARRVNAIIASAMAVTLAIPSTTIFSNSTVTFAEEEEDDMLAGIEPVAYYDFERGFKAEGITIPGSGSKTPLYQYQQVTNEAVNGEVVESAVYIYNNEGEKTTGGVSNQPYISEDEERGNVFTLQDSVTTVSEIYTKVPTSISGDGVTRVDEEGNAMTPDKVESRTVHSEAIIENPFAAYAEELTEEVVVSAPSDTDHGLPIWEKGVTISFWMKSPEAKSATGAGLGYANDTSILYFETNDIDNVMHKDDAAQYKIGQMYEANPDDPMFSTGTTKAKVDIGYNTVATPKFDAEGYFKENTNVDDTKGRGYEYKVVVTEKTVTEGELDTSLIGGVSVSGDNSAVPRFLQQKTSLSTVDENGDVVWVIGKDSTKAHLHVTDPDRAAAIQQIVDDAWNAKYGTTCTKAGAFQLFTKNEWYPIKGQEVFKLLEVGDSLRSQDKVLFVVTKADPVNGEVELTSVAKLSSDKVADELAALEANVTTTETTCTVNNPYCKKSVTIVENLGKYAKYNPNLSGSGTYQISGGKLVGVGSTVNPYCYDEVTYDAVNAKWVKVGDSKTKAKYSFPVGSNRLQVKYLEDANDTCTLAFNYSGSWVFQESIYDLPLLEGKAQDGQKTDDATGFVVQNKPVNNENMAYGGAYSKIGDKTNESAAEVSPVNTPDTWIFVTYVIQNNKVNTYYNGELVDAELYHNNAGVLGAYATNQFNLGAGYRDLAVSGLEKGYDYTTYNYYASADFKYETEQLGIGSYTQGMTIMELLTREDTKIHLGGQSSAATAKASWWGMDDGTTAGTCIDNLAFYIEPFTEDMVVALYEKECKAEERNLTPVASYSYTYATTGGAIVEAPMNVDKLDPTKDKIDAPSIVEDASKGAVLKLEASKTTEASAVKLDNPYVGNDEMTGATFSYWVKADAEKIKESATVTFYETSPQAIEHGKLAAQYEGQTASSVLYATTAGKAEFVEAYTSEAGRKSLKNVFTMQSATEKYLAEATEWHYMTVVATNKEIKVYRDGELVEQTIDNTAATGAKSWGPRFYDGYYQTMDDIETGFAIEDGIRKDMTIFGGTGNQRATSIMTYLTSETTDIYLGFLPTDASKTSYKASSAIYMDDVDFYDFALTAEEVATIYEAAVENFNTDVKPDDGKDDNGDDSTVTVVLGDVNADEYVDTLDAIEVLKYAAGMDSAVTGDALVAADVNEDEFVDTLDAIEILKFAAGMDCVLTQKAEDAEPVEPSTGDAVTTE